MKYYSKKNKGFTLIELMVVVSIIALLSSIVLSALNDARKKARDTAKVREVQEIRKALNNYYSDFGYYPCPSIAAIVPSNITGLRAGLIPKYITSISNNIYYYGREPYNPTPADNYGAKWKSSISGTACSSYHLGTILESNSVPVFQSDADDITRGDSNYFDGTSADCLDGATDFCYDVTP